MCARPYNFSYFSDKTSEEIFNNKQRCWFSRKENNESKLKTAQLSSVCCGDGKCWTLRSVEVFFQRISSLLARHNASRQVFDVLAFTHHRKVIIIEASTINSHQGRAEIFQAMDNESDTLPARTRLGIGNFAIDYAFSLASNNSSTDFVQVRMWCLSWCRMQIFCAADRRTKLSYLNLSVRSLFLEKLWLLHGLMIWKLRISAWNWWKLFLLKTANRWKINKSGKVFWASTSLTFSEISHSNVLPGEFSSQKFVSDRWRLDARRELQRQHGVQSAATSLIDDINNLLHRIYARIQRWTYRKSVRKSLAANSDVLIDFN